MKCMNSFNYVIKITQTQVLQQILDLANEIG